MDIFGKKPQCADFRSKCFACAGALTCGYSANRNRKNPGHLGRSRASVGGIGRREGISLDSQASLLTTLYSVSTEANSKKRTKIQKELIDSFPAD